MHVKLDRLTKSRVRSVTWAASQRKAYRRRTEMLREQRQVQVPGMVTAIRITMGVEEIHDLQSGTGHGPGSAGPSFPSHQQIKRAGHTLDRLGRHLGVDRRGFQLGMAEQMAVSTGLAALVLSIQNAQFQSMDLWDVVPGDATRNRDPDDDDRCAEARVKLDRAKEITNQLGRCYADMGLAERFLRHTAWRRELFARSEKDIACHGAPDGGHGIAQKNALNQMRRCATGGL